MDEATYLFVSRIISDTNTEANHAHNCCSTLEEINQDIALRVIQETGGNQTAAAKRLGISRTTLWRLVKKQMGPSSAHEK